MFDRLLHGILDSQMVIFMDGSALGVAAVCYLTGLSGLPLIICKGLSSISVSIKCDKCID